MKDQRNPFGTTEGENEEKPSPTAWLGVYTVGVRPKMRRERYSTALAQRDLARKSWALTLLIGGG